MPPSRGPAAGSIPPIQRLGVQHVLPISSPEDLARVPVDGASVRLGDVAKVVEGHPLVIGDAFHNGGAGLLMLIEKFPGANTLEITRGVETALDALRLGLPGIEVDPRIFRAATFIEMAFENLGIALLLGGVLVVLVLGAFMASWRTALICLIAIPLSLLTAAVVLSLRGATLNTMVLAGFVIAVGVIVDDAIIAVEHIGLRLRPAPVGRQRSVDGLDHMGRDARGEPTRSLRDADRPARSGSRLLHGGLVGRLLHASGGLLYSGGRRLRGGRPDRHPRAGLDAPGRRAHQGPRGPGRPVVAARL